MNRDPDLSTAQNDSDVAVALRRPPNTNRLQEGCQWGAATFQSGDCPLTFTIRGRKRAVGLQRKRAASTSHVYARGPPGFPRFLLSVFLTAPPALLHCLPFSRFDTSTNLSCQQQPQDVEQSLRRRWQQHSYGRVVGILSARSGRLRRPDRGTEAVRTPIRGQHTVPSHRGLTPSPLQLVLHSIEHFILAD